MASTSWNLLVIGFTSTKWTCIYETTGTAISTFKSRTKLLASLASRDPKGCNKYGKYNYPFQRVGLNDSCFQTVVLPPIRNPISAPAVPHWGKNLSDKRQGKTSFLSSERGCGKSIGEQRENLE